MRKTSKKEEEEEEEEEQTKRSHFNNRRCRLHKPTKKLRQTYKKHVTTA